MSEELQFYNVLNTISDWEDFAFAREKEFLQMFYGSVDCYLLGIYFGKDAIKFSFVLKDGTLLTQSAFIEKWFEFYNKKHE